MVSALRRKPAEMLILNLLSFLHHFFEIQKASVFIIFCTYHNSGVGFFPVPSYKSSTAQSLSITVVFTQIISIILAIRPVSPLDSAFPSSYASDDSLTLHHPQILFFTKRHGFKVLHLHHF